MSVPIRTEVYSNASTEFPLENPARLCRTLFTQAGVIVTALCSPKHNFQFESCVYFTQQINWRWPM